MKPEHLGNAEMTHMKWGKRWKYNHGIFIDEVWDDEKGKAAYFMANRFGNPSENIGQAATLPGALQLACYYLDAKELEALKAENPFDKIRPHLGHADCLEIAVYAKGLSITVECVRCMTVIHELYNAEEDDGYNTRTPEQ